MSNIYSPENSPYNGFYPIYEKVREGLVAGEYVILDANGIVERSFKPIQRQNNDSPRTMFSVQVWDGDLAFYKNLHQVKHSPPKVFEDIEVEIRKLLEDISRESQSSCTLEVKEFSSSWSRIFSSSWSRIFSSVSCNLILNNWSLSNKYQDRLGDLLLMLEISGSGFGCCKITLNSSSGKFTMYSLFDYYTIYGCLPQHKTIEGHYPYTEARSGERLGEYLIRIDLGLVYLNNQIVGFARPKRLMEKL